MDEARKSSLDEALGKQDVMETYITQLRCGDIKPGKSGNTWPLDQLYMEDSEGLFVFKRKLSRQK